MILQHFYVENRIAHATGTPKYGMQVSGGDSPLGTWPSLFLVLASTATSEKRTNLCNELI